MKQNIGVFTEARTNYDLLYHLIKDLQADNNLTFKLIFGIISQFLFHADAPFLVTDNLKRRIICLPLSANLTIMKS